MSIYERRYPIGSAAESHFQLFAEVPENVYAEKILFFNDDEILKIYQDTKVSLADHGVDIFKTKRGDWVFPQIPHRGCGEACIMMLAYKVLLKQGQPLNLHLYKTRATTTHQNQVNSLKRMNLTVNAFTADVNDPLFSINERIKQFGPCIATVYDEEIKNHVIVVDNVDLKKNKVTLRDPFHGWQIDVSSQSFLKRFSKVDECIQIEENAPEKKSCTIL